MTENKNILVIGLGSMGYGIAKSLMRAGYKVYGQDKNPDQQKNFFKMEVLTVKSHTTN